MHRDLKSMFRWNRIDPTRPLARRTRRGRAARLEILEDRTLLAASATLDISAGTLSFAVIGGPMNLSVSVDAGNVYTFQDPTQTITLGGGASGWTLSPDGHTATGPAASFSQIAVIGDGAAFDDAVNINSTKAPATVSTGAGDDAFTFNAPAITAAVSLTNPLSTTSDGDTVHFLTGGMAGTLSTGAKGRESYQAAGGGLIDVASVKPNFSDSFAGLSISTSTLSINLNSLYATPTPLDATLSVVGSNVQIAVTNVPTRLFPNGSIAGLSIQGTSGGNSLTLDYAGGIPYGAGVTFSPAAPTGGAENALVLQNGSFTQEAYIASGAGAGSLIFPNRQVNGATIGNRVDFSNLSPITDTLAVAGFSFTAPVGAQTVHVIDGPIVSSTQTTQINDGGTSHFELINFANKTAVSINAGSGGDLVAVDMTALAAGLTNMAIVTGDGDDAVAVVATPAGLGLGVDTGPGTINQVAISNAGSLADVLGPVAVESTGGTAALKLDDAADATGRNFTIAPGQVSGGPLGSVIGYSGGGITNVQVRGGSGDDLFTFSDFGSTTTATAYFIDGGPGADTLTVDSTLPTVNYSVAGVLTFGPDQPTINYTRIEQVNLSQATAPPVGIPVVVHATEAQAFVQRTVARFTDAAPGAPVDYYASINWGDGTPSSGGVIVPTGVTGTYEILGGHSYAAAATYPVNVTLTRQGGSSTTTTVGGVTITVTSGGPADSVPSPIPSSAVVNAAPLGAQGVPLVGRATAPLASGAGGIQVASFTDAGTNLAPSAYKALIYWGDGSSPTAATQITAIGTAGGVVYNVFGDHTYANPGTYPVTVLITKPPTAVAAPVVAQSPPGAQAIAVSTATILDAPLRTVTGQLNPASDSGASHADGITNVVQPNYFGLADSPGASIAVVATPTAGGTSFLLGAAQADNSGAWNATSNAAIADGAYTITVYASDRFDGSNVVTAVLPQTLVVDTVGPRIVDAVFTPKGGYVLATYQDYGGASNAGSGLNVSTVQDPSNYAFAFVSSPVRGYKPPKQWLVGPITTNPGTTVGPQAATVLINGGTPIRGGVYQLTITSATAAAWAGLQDIAGNALDGEFYSTFPSGNNVNGGNFVAQLDSIHNRVFAPQTVVGPGTPNNKPTRTPPGKVVRKPPTRVVRTPPTKVVRKPPARAKAVPTPRVQIVRTLPAKASG